MSKELEKLIQSAKQITLSPEKKALIRAHIQDFIELTPITKSISKPILSPLVSRVSVSYFSKAISFALIVLIAGGSTISYASEDTLPGDTLYTVKVNVKEPLEEKLAFSPQAKLEVKTKQVEKRLTEAQTLLQNNDISPEKHKEVESRVEKQVEEISQTITELQEKGDVETILSTTSKLQPVLKAHQEALQEVAHTSLEKTVEENSEEPLTLSATEVSLSAIATQTTQIANTSTASIDASEIELKSSLADSLLKTVEKTLLQVEGQETKALESVAELEVNEINTELISTVTDKKVEEATKEINQIKDEISQAETKIAQENLEQTETTEETLTQDIQELNESLKRDATLLTISDAEMLLAESKKLFDEGFYKESLEKAQEAIKITAMIEANKKIDEAKEIVMPEEQITVLPEKELIPEEKMTPLENQIQIEEQASQAIQSLESSLNLKANKNAQ
jgi:hypothetical protein